MLAAMHETPRREAPPDLERLRSQDPLAFRAFVVKHQRPVFALISRITGRGAHVDDLAQETFLRAYRALPGFDPAGPAKVSTWLLTITTRVALDARKQGRRTFVELDEAKDHSVQDTPELDRHRTELRAALEAAARDLPDDQCAALVLAEFHGLSIAEVASVLETPEATVKTRLFRAREKMRERLREFHHTTGSLS